MHLVASHMDHNSFNHAAHTAANPPVAFKPPPAPLSGTSSGSSPPSPGTGSMNYSPRHSRKPTSLSSSRNINIQRLSLAASPPQVGSVTSPPRRGKPLALSIPMATSPSLSSHSSIQTPIREHSSMADFRTTRSSSIGDVSSLTGSTGSIHAPPCTNGLFEEGGPSKLRSPFKSGLGSLAGSVQNSNEHLSQDITSLHIDPDAKSANDHLANGAAVGQFHDSPYTLDPRSFHADTAVQSGPQTLSRESSNAVFVPEELQEIALTYAYPEGPANVLNSILYLYSDPDTSHLPVDINDYDLVVNVARECDDLTPRFNDHNGTRRYLHVPWSHTSKISKDLPMITQEIAAMDKPGKRILVHCQCGVSRSACVVVAYFMVKFKVSVNEAYELLKSGTINMSEPCSRQIKDAGNYVDACERICPNMNLIFELMDFGDKLKNGI